MSCRFFSSGFCMSAGGGSLDRFSAFSYTRQNRPVSIVRPAHRPSIVARMLTMNRRLTITSAATTALAAILLTTFTACERKTQGAQVGRAATTVPVILRPVKILPVQRAVDGVGTLHG